MAQPEQQREARGPAAAVVAEYLHRIIRDLEAGRQRHVAAQLAVDLWPDIMKRLGVPGPLALATLQVLSEVRARFDPDDPTTYPGGARDTVGASGVVE